jgi:hypothetical protein
MTNPSKHDIYYTQIKTKYLKGLVSTTTSSVATAGKTTIYKSTGLYCDKALEFVDSAGVAYYIPAYIKDN